MGEIRGPVVCYSDDEIAGKTDSEDEGEKPFSTKKQRKLNWLTVAELKQLMFKLKVVEWTDVSLDVSAADPRLSLHLKCYRNTIPIPAKGVPNVIIYRESAVLKNLLSKSLLRLLTQALQLSAMPSKKKM